MKYIITYDEALGISWDDVNTLKEIKLYEFERSRQSTQMVFSIRYAIQDAENGTNHFNLNVEHLELVKNMLKIVFEEAFKFGRKIRYLHQMVRDRSNAEDFNAILLYLRETIDSYDQCDEMFSAVKLTIGDQNQWNTFSVPDYNSIRERLQGPERNLNNSIDSLLGDEMECSREVRMRFYRINQAIRDAQNGTNHFNLDAEHLELVKDMFHLVLEEVRKFTRKINYLIKLICLRSNAEDFRERICGTLPKPIFVVPEQLEYIEYDSIDSLLDDDASERFEEDD
uniref:Uncharacterized protein n=2 Tax=Lutzomyia longipalpis TaxID=7200 RepID=A0A1B0CGP2_LUTLO